MGDTLAADDFIRKLRNGALHTPLTCSGLAKSIDARDEAFLFSPGRSLTRWVTIPAAMVESVEFLGEESSGGTSYSAVRVRFREPSDREPEALVFASLLRASVGGDGGLSLSADAALVPAAAASSFLPSVGPAIAAIIAAVAALIVILAEVEAKSRERPREEELIGALRLLLSKLEHERNG